MRLQSLSSNGAALQQYSESERSPHHSHGHAGERGARRVGVAYNRAMTDTEELADRYLALWSRYLTALLADTRAMETLKRWMAFTSQFAYPAPGAAQQSGAPFPAWPPFFGPFAPPSMPAAPSVVEADTVAALARRVDELERRLAALEDAVKPVARHPRRRMRTGS